MTIGQVRERGNHNTLVERGTEQTARDQRLCNRHRIHLVEEMQLLCRPRAAKRPVTIIDERGNLLWSSAGKHSPRHEDDTHVDG